MYAIYLGPMGIPMSSMGSPPSGRAAAAGPVEAAADLSASPKKQEGFVRRLFATKGSKKEGWLKKKIEALRARKGNKTESATRDIFHNRKSQLWL